MSETSPESSLLTKTASLLRSAACKRPQAMNEHASINDASRIAPARSANLVRGAAALCIAPIAGSSLRECCELAEAGRRRRGALARLRAKRNSQGMTLQAIVLGSAAGGGFPQWNCACANCARARSGELPSRTQDSLAVSADGHSWFLLNASPDLARQIERTSVLWPRRGRSSPIQGVVLTNGDIDHVLGLFMLRENQPLVVYATPQVRAGLEQNVMFKTLQRFEDQLTWRSLDFGREQQLQGADGLASGIFVRAFAAPGKLPVHLIDHGVRSVGDNCGLSLRGSGDARLVYASATATVEPIFEQLDAAAVLLLDGTFWSETELGDRGLGSARARDMAHVVMSGSAGSLALCRELRTTRRFYTHINNTNPVLDSRSAERRSLNEHGWQLAEDGLRLQV